MSKTNIDIPILGMDKRLSERQSVPGLCASITGLEPVGSERAPYWKRAKNVGSIPLVHDVPGNLLVHAAWHTRSGIGKFNQTSISLKRLVCFYSNGSVRVYDPALNHQVTARLDLIGSGYTFTTADINNGLAFTAVNDSSSTIYLIVDDLIVPFEFPEPPVIIPYSEGYESVTEELEQAGVWDSFGPGGIYVAYAIRLIDGSLIKLSNIRYLQLPIRLTGSINDPETVGMVHYSLKFYHDGYRQTTLPDHIEFWQTQIAGIALLAGGYKAARGEDRVRIPEESDMDDILFYEVGSFPFLNNEGKAKEDCIVEFYCKPEELSSYPLAQVDTINNRITGDSVSSYNSRLIVNGSAEDFPMPKLPVSATISEFVAISSYRGTNLTIELIGDLPRTSVAGNIGHMASVTNAVGLSNIELERHMSHRTNKITATINNPAWSLIININEVTITVDHSHTGVVPAGNYQINYAGSVVAAIDIETSHSVFTRVWVSPQNIIKRTGARESGYLAFRNYIFFYPDRRAKTMYLYEAGQLVSQQELKKSNTQNIAYAVEHLSASDTSRSLPNASVNEKLNHIPNRIHVSEVNAPFSYLASRVYYIGNSPENKIVAVASNTLAVSEGQFGHYPLYVFCRNSIWAMEQGSNPEIAFQRISPVSLSHGVQSIRHIINVGRQIAFIYKDGIFIIAGNQINEIGQPIGNHPGQDTIDFSKAILGSRQRGGDNELFVSLPAQGIVYVYNLRFRRWYKLQRNRQWWFTNEGQLYGIADDGSIYSYQDELDTPVSYSINFRPIHFGRPDQLKRLHACYVRGDVPGMILQISTDNGGYIPADNTYKRLRLKSAYEYSIEISGQMSSDDHYIETITAQVEPRYPHKTRVP